MTRARRTAVVVAAVLALVVTGCTETPQVRAGNPTLSDPAASDPAGSDSGPSAPGGSDPGVTVASTPALAQQKKAAGLPDCPVSDASVAPAAKGLPDLTLACLGGGRSTRLAGLRGTPMVVNLWAQWCGPCRTEAPYLSEVARQAAGRLLVVGVDYKETDPGLALDFARTAGWTYPQLFDPDGRTTEALRLPTGPPQTIFVDADGVVTFVHAGEFTSAAALRTAIGHHLGVTL